FTRAADHYWRRPPRLVVICPTHASRSPAHLSIGAISIAFRFRAPRSVLHIPHHLVPASPCHAGRIRRSDRHLRTTHHVGHSARTDLDRRRIHRSYRSSGTGGGGRLRLARRGGAYRS